MSKKGTKPDYVKIGSATNPTRIQEVVNGHLIGISQHKHSKNYYTMIPKALLPKGAKRSEQKWLGADLTIAVAKFRAILNEIRGSRTDVKTLKEFVGRDIKKDGTTKRVIVDEAYFPETYHIEWLKKELQDPSALAKKTGIPELANVGQLLAKDTNIPLSGLIKNYLKKKKKITKHEAECSEKWFNTFCEVIECSTVDAITLPAIHKYEDYIYTQSLSSKSIKHRINKISTIFNYNTGRYNSPHIIQVHKWLKGLDRPEEDKPYNPSLMTLENFDKLYDASNLKWKSMLLLGLNSAMYPMELSRLKKSDINFDQGTIAFRRGKTGKVLAVSTLWKRSLKSINEYLATRKDRSQYVFITKFGKKYEASGITNSFNETIRKKANVDKTVKFSHLRDTFATLAQDLGYSIEQINLVLGHQNRGMQDRYAVRQAKKLTGEMCLAVEKEFFKK